MGRGGPRAEAFARGRVRMNLLWTTPTKEDGEGRGGTHSPRGAGSLTPAPEWVAGETWGAPAPCAPCPPTAQHPWGKERSPRPCLPPPPPARGPCLRDWGPRGPPGPECHSLPRPPLTSVPPPAATAPRPVLAPSPQPPPAGAASGSYASVCLSLSLSSRAPQSLVFLSTCPSLPEAPSLKAPRRWPAGSLGSGSTSLFIRPSPLLRPGAGGRGGGPASAGGPGGPGRAAWLRVPVWPDLGPALLQVTMVATTAPMGWSPSPLWTRPA